MQDVNLHGVDRHRELIESCEMLLRLEDFSISEIMGFPDDLKLKSSMTLFAQVSPQSSIFSEVLSKYYEDDLDQTSLEIIKRMEKNN